MEQDLILAIDQGTTGTTCLLVDQQLNIVARASCEFEQHFPKPGWVEHDVDELWQSVLSAIARVTGQSDVSPARIAAIGITNQRETSMIWRRKDGVAIHRALVWQDRRTAASCEQLRQRGLEPQITVQTGLVLDPYFSATKLAWMLDQVDGARRQTEEGELAAGTVDTFLVWKLTGGAVHATEPSNASRTMLFPLEGTDWSADLCELLDVPQRILPEIRHGTAEFGTTKGVPGLPDGIPIRGIAGDQQAALFGQACFVPGEAKCTYGTGAFVMLNTGSAPIRSNHGLLTTIGWQLDDQRVYCLEGSAFMAGAVVQWLRDGLEIIDSANEIEALAASVPDSGGVVLVPAHTGLGAPHWRADARGLISGLTRGTTRAHLARAALEGIALQITDLLRAMTEDTGTPLRALRVDGGAAANDLLMQLQANLISVPLLRPKNLETTALGAVFLAGLGIGLWSDTEQLRKAWQRDRDFQPEADPQRMADLQHAWKQAVEKA